MTWKRSKGGVWEREVCRRLSLWVTKGKRDDLFWRTTMSGGRATIRLREGHSNFSQVGDITAIDELGHRAITRHVIVECKFYKNLDCWSGITKRKGRLFRFWFKEVEKAKKYNSVSGLGLMREPFLIGKDNWTPGGLIITTHRALGRLFKEGLAIGDESAIACLYDWPLQPFLFVFDHIVPRLPKGKK